MSLKSEVIKNQEQQKCFWLSHHPKKKKKKNQLNGSSQKQYPGEDLFVHQSHYLGKLMWICMRKMFLFYTLSWSLSHVKQTLCICVHFQDISFQNLTIWNKSYTTRPWHIIKKDIYIINILQNRDTFWHIFY